MKCLVCGLLGLWTTLASAGWAPLWPLVETEANLYDPIILSNLVGAVNERCIVSGVATLEWASVASGFVTRAKLELIDAKIDEMLATERWVETRHAVDAEYNTWYRLTDEDPPGTFTTNWVAWLPRMNRVESFDTLPLGMTRMVVTNRWDYRSNAPPAEAWWTFWPGKPHRQIMADYVWVTNENWVAAAEASDGGKHKINSPVAGYWVDARFYYSTDESTTRGSAYNISNLATWGITETLPPRRAPGLSGRFYTENIVPKAVYRTDGWGAASGSGNVTIDLVGWQYLTNFGDPMALTWNFDTQEVGKVQAAGVETETVEPGGEASLDQVFFRADFYNDVSPGDRYRPTRFLKADNGGIREGDRITILWDLDGLDLYGGPSVFTGVTSTWASILFAECLDERYHLLNAMRWSTSTNYGWAVDEECVINEGDPSLSPTFLADGSLDPNRAPSQTSWYDKPWGAMGGYGQASIGGLAPADEPFDWACPHDTGNTTDFEWPGNGDDPWPTFFVITNSIAGPTNTWGCGGASPESPPVYEATWVFYTQEVRLAHYYTANPDYWDSQPYSPVGQCVHGSPATTSRFVIVGRWGVRGYLGSISIPDWSDWVYPYAEGDSSEYGSDLRAGIAYTNVTSKPWVDLEVLPGTESQLPTSEVDFYLYATNAWWSDDAPQYIPVKRQTAAGAPGMGVVTGAVEYANEAALVVGGPTTGYLPHIDNYVSDVSTFSTETNVNFVAELGATLIPTSWWFCVTNRYHDPSITESCVYTNGATNWYQFSTNYWRISNSIPVWVWDCDGTVYSAIPNPLDPEPEFTFTYDWIPHDYDPPDTCYEWLEGTVIVAQTHAILESDHSQWVTTVYTAEPPGCADFLVRRAMSREWLEWWDVQVPTNCVVGQWEPVIRWNFEYLSD